MTETLRTLFFELIDTKQYDYAELIAAEDMTLMDFYFSYIDYG